MVNETGSVSRRGLYDWLVQRFSAVYMVFCLAGLIFYLVAHPHPSYLDWRLLFAGMTVKILTLLFFVSLMLHAWVGMWTVFTDYITCGYLRISLQAVMIFALGGFFFAGVLIVWGL